MEKEINIGNITAKIAAENKQLFAYIANNGKDDIETDFIDRHPIRFLECNLRGTSNFLFVNPEGILFFLI